MTQIVDIASITERIRSVGLRARKEEDVRIGVEKILDEVIRSFELQPAFYEYTFVAGGRADALYGYLIIEYESPNALQSRSRRAHAIQQLKEYIEKAGGERILSKYLGVAIDGKQIAFVRFSSRESNWLVRGPFNITIDTVGRLVEAFRGLKRKPLDADVMITDFGPNSDIAKEVVRAFYNTPLRNERAKVLYNDWRRVFKQVAAYSPEKAQGLEEIYEINGKTIDYEKLLFAIHSYYALIMKLIAAEVVVLYGGGRFIRSYISELLDAQLAGKLKDKLKEVEEGELFKNLLGLENFLEADYFSWYMDEWNDKITDVVKLMINRLSEYEPATADLEPERVKDLFKRLYQNLVPKKIRHDMGEYYTPDWLAELLLDKIGYDRKHFDGMLKAKKDQLAPLEVRLLDPACGSGTFLVLAIKRIKEYSYEHFIDSQTVVTKLLNNVVGFDLNPLAVIAARTNYLLAMGDLLRFVKKNVAIPVFLADSIMVERRSTLTGDSYVLRTTVGEFKIPIRIIELGLLTKLLSAIENMVKLRYTPSEFEASIKKEFLEMDEQDFYSVRELYSMFLKLENEGRNRIWSSIIKNSFAPLYVGTFDVIVGNPPWINWDSLPDGYRENLRELYNFYHIMPEKALSQANVDISTLFVYRMMDKMLKESGCLAFLITQTVFKSMPAEGFRRFRFDTTNIGISEVDDLVDLKPFEGAQNRTALFVAKKGISTNYPIRYLVWQRTGNASIDQSTSLDTIKKNTKCIKLWAEPLGRSDTAPWMTLHDKQILRKLDNIVGSSNLLAQNGIHTKGANAIFWIQIIETEKDRALIQNVVEGAKKQFRQVKKFVEKDLLYPVLRGRNVTRWKVTPNLYVIFPHDEQDGSTLKESFIKVNYPEGYAYLKSFENELKSRQAYGTPVSKKDIPFYTIFQVNERTMKPYKVVWREVATQLDAAVVKPGRNIKTSLKPIICDHTLCYISFNHEDEAHYVCSILNSLIARLIVKSYVHLHVSPHIMNFVRIPIFNPRSALHKELVKLSKKAHDYAESTKIKEIENTIDRKVAKLYGLTSSSLNDIKESMELLEGE